MLRNAVLVACCAVVGLGSIPLRAAEKIPSYITAAIADPGRPAEDKERDANRKPAETVLFAGIKPGTTVVELIPDADISRASSAKSWTEGARVCTFPTQAPHCAG